jgi:hypothetical protein
MLHADRRTIVAAIEALEKMVQSPVFSSGQRPIRRRGRKSMDVTERQEVSDRMKKYWAQRRKSATGENRPSPKYPRAAAD